MENNNYSNRVVIPNKIPPGVPGAGWVLGLMVAFSVLMLTADIEGWSFSSAQQTAAPAAPPAHHNSMHATTGAGQ
jgi:hypothetical protein